MNGSPNASIDPTLIASWLTARSVARGLPAPVADHGGWRVYTRSEIEACRYVFAAPGPGLATLAQTLDQPRIFLKACVEGAAFATLLPARWTIVAPSWLMVAGTPPPDRPLPAGYTALIAQAFGATHVSITAADGSLAASGYAAETAGVFVYDRIVTAAAHQRRGLGGAVMAALRSHRQSEHSREVLVATGQGRALYTSLGWSVYAPYASAVIPDPAS